MSIHIAHSVFFKIFNYNYKKFLGGAYQGTDGRVWNFFTFVLNSSAASKDIGGLSAGKPDSTIGFVYKIYNIKDFQRNIMQAHIIIIMD